LTKAKVINDESISLEISNQQASLIKLVLSRFASNFAGPLKEIYDELDDIGIEFIQGVRLVSQSEPNLYLGTQED